MVGAERLPELSDRPNLPYLDAFLTEMVRIVSETPLTIPHSTTRDTTVAGFFILRDVIHHDIEYWVEPFTFRPERFLNEDRQLRVDGMLPQLEYACSLRKSLAKKAVFLFIARLFHRFKLSVKKVKKYLPKKIVILEFCVIVNRLKSVPSREINSIFPYTGTT